LAVDEYLSNEKRYRKSISILESANFPAFEGKPAQVDKIDFQKLMAEAEELGKKSCTNNAWYIYDSYYSTHVEPTLEKRRNTLNDASYAVSPEYADLEIFLDICQETGIEPLLILEPVNGLSYDYAGFPLEGREAYYRQIRELAARRGVRLADFSSHEYEPYFLADVMHIGWKGWVYILEEIVKFYKEN
jgi:D-alanine transfer protein